MEINWNEIKDKYPKAFNFFCYELYYNKTPLIEDLEENICFCDIKHIMSLKEIFINVNKVVGYMHYFYIIEFNRKQEYGEIKKNLFEAEKQVSIESFEILNNLLEGKQ
jgi:hypothetical protein